ncbi:hypothetical protein D3C78_1908610 [compost metagenome]
MQVIARLGLKLDFFIADPLAVKLDRHGVDTRNNDVTAAELGRIECSDLTAREKTGVECHFFRRVCRISGSG